MEKVKDLTSIALAIEEYIGVVRLIRSQNTVLTYGKALKEFKRILVETEIDPETSDTSKLNEDLISKYGTHDQATHSQGELSYTAIPCKRH